MRPWRDRQRRRDTDDLLSAPDRGGVLPVRSLAACRAPTTSPNCGTTLIGLAGLAGFAELKRSLREGPQLASFGVGPNSFGKQEAWRAAAAAPRRSSPCPDDPGFDAGSFVNGVPDGRPENL
jgi:hypothetical protein